MNPVSLIRRGISVYREKGLVLFIRKSIAFIIGGVWRENNRGTYPKEISQLKDLSDEELLTIVRHEAHRIEKAVYNEILSEKRDYYEEKSDRIENCVKILVNERDFPIDHPIISWAIEIQSLVQDRESTLISEKSSAAPEVNLTELDEFVEFVKNRRSTRVWSDDQPSGDKLHQVASKMIEGAKWAPNSGNRQAWRFKIITEEDEKNLLGGIKEDHTVSAPLLIFVGMDKRMYGDVADSETSIYLDAGAAVMQMTLTAHNAGLGTCWNHFGMDLINSRKKNKEDYAKFTEQLAIPDYIEPMAILCAGKPKFIPPTPVRPSNQEYIIS